MELTFTIPAEEVAIVRLKGKFTIESVQRFRELTSPLITLPVKAILIDFGMVRYIDSSGIGSLILLMNRANNISIDLVLYDLQVETEMMFGTAHLGNFFRTSTSAELKKTFPGIGIEDAS
ncbi:MAG: anti-sigma factor antagonist [Chrysiogenales bacterium]|nr:MAG: anti-sigma factor antagonist [Chrysiogenales bacterium]